MGKANSICVYWNVRWWEFIYILLPNSGSELFINHLPAEIHLYFTLDGKTFCYRIYNTFYIDRIRSILNLTSI